MINSKQKVLIFASAITQNNKLHHDKKVNVMSSKFVIGNREKKEWISVLDTNEKELVFTGNLTNAKEYPQEEDAQYDLSEIQNTGYFRDLQIYIKTDNKAYKINERDSFM